MTGLTGLKNARDLGGLAGAGGRRVREKRLIRSENLSRLTDADKRVLTAAFDLRRVIDLRTDIEKNEYPDPAMEAVTYVWHPILDASTLGITHVAGEKQRSHHTMIEQMAQTGQTLERYMEAVYRELIHNPHAVKKYGQFLDLLGEEAGGATLWHCTAGKDRAGLGSAFILSALGADRDVVTRDFLLTNEAYRPDFDAARVKALEAGESAAFIDCLSGLYCVSERSLEAVFEGIEHACGSMAAYLRDALGQDGRKIDRLRAMYLD